MRWLCVLYVLDGNPCRLKLILHSGAQVMDASQCQPWQDTAKTPRK